MEVTEVDPGEAIAWENGYFQFHDGTVSRSMQLGQVLKVMP